MTIETYFSVDVETDGPIPGPYSMRSIGIVVAGFRDERGRFVRADLSDTFYRELLPISDQYDPEAQAIAGIDRAHGGDPTDAMVDAAAWIHARAESPIMVAYPLGFDWSWVHWYFVRFVGSSPFKHSRGFDLKTAIATKLNRPIVRSGHRHLPSSRQCTHNALDDAIAQAEIFCDLFS